MSEAAQILAERDAEIAAISGNPELTTEAKQGRISAVQEAYREEYEQARAAEQARVQERLESAHKAVYRVPTGQYSSEGEQAQVFTAFRSAWADVEIATAGENVLHAEQHLGEILDLADRTGDTLLARAAYHKALDLGIEPVVERFLSTRKGEAAAYQRYVEAKGQAEQATSFESLLSGAMTNNLF
jgi:hypothetical protein